MRRIALDKSRCPLHCLSLLLFKCLYTCYSPVLSASSMNNSNFDIWIAGAFAAVFVDFLVYPFDTVKTRIQSPKYEQIYKDSKTGRVKRHLLFRGVYQGVWSVVFATIPSSGAFFTTYEAIKYTLTNAPTTCPHPEKNRLPFTHTLPQPIIHSIASSSAEMVACFMLTPAEVIKQNAQVVQSKEHLNKDKGHANKMKDNRNKDRVGRNATIQAISQFREKPWRLWSGYTALVGRNLPFTGLTYPIFESTRERLIECRRQRRAQAMHTNVSDAENTNPLVERAVFTGISAGMSGTIVSTITTPIDVVKTRMMLAASDGQQRDDDNRNEKEKKQKHRGSWAVGKEIYHKEGTRGLFRGGAVRAGWTAISLSLYLTMYEGMRFYLEDRRNGKDTKNHEHERGETGI